MWYYNLMHQIGLHSYDLPALAVTLGTVISLLVHNHKQKKRDEKFEEEMKGEAAEAASPVK